MSLWKGVPVRIAVFKGRFIHGGRYVQDFVTRHKTLLDEYTMPSLFNMYPPQDGYVFTVTPRREGDDHSEAPTN